jgi:hypothetical protein
MVREAASLASDYDQLGSQKEKLQESPTRAVRRFIEQQSQKLVKRKLRLLERNDEAIRQALQRREKLSGIMSAEDSAAGDELLWFIADELELLPLIEELAPPPTRVDKKTGKEVKCRQMYGAAVLNLLSLLCRFLGKTKNPELQAAVFCDERWMHLFGFNAQEVANGSTQRSSSLLGKTREGSGGKFVDADSMGPVRSRLEGARGALSSQTLSQHESTLEASNLLNLFNGVVRALAAKGYFDKQVKTSLDSTGIEVVPSFPDAGSVKKKVKVDSKARKPKQVEVIIRGFKVWYVMDVKTGLPLSMAMERIETAEIKPAKALITQAQENLKGHATIVSCAVDRGFLDGDFLWWLKDKNDIDWVCPSKEHMKLTDEARECVEEAVKFLRQENESMLETASRAARQGLSYDKVQFFEQELSKNRQTAIVAQVDELYETDFYGEGGSKSSRIHSKSFKPTALHATVVLRWPDRSQKDIEDTVEHDPNSKGPIVLMSSIPEAGLIRLARYDERSEIENRMNRDGKQYFGLGDTLSRNRQALFSSTVFATLALMFYRAMELHEEQMQEHLDRRSERLGVLRYRRQLALMNRDRIVIVVGNICGMITLREFASIAGFEVM